MKFSCNFLDHKTPKWPPQRDDTAATSRIFIRTRLQLPEIMLIHISIRWEPFYKRTNNNLTYSQSLYLIEKTLSLDSSYWIKMPCPLLIFSQITCFRLVIQIHMLKDKQCRSRLVGFVSSQLMWICNVCKSMAYSGSAGPELIITPSSEVRPGHCFQCFFMWCLI